MITSAAKALLMAAQLQRRPARLAHLAKKARIKKKTLATSAARLVKAGLATLSQDVLTLTDAGRSWQPPPPPPEIDLMALARAAARVWRWPPTPDRFIAHPSLHRGIA